MNHYICYKLIGKDWFCYDDKSVKKVGISGKYHVSLAFYKSKDYTLMYYPRGDMFFKIHVFLTKYISIKQCYSIDI